MGRRMAGLIVASVLLGSAVLAAVVIWQAKAHHVPHMYVGGVFALVSGIGFFLLNLSVTDEYLRQHFGGEPNASRIRGLWGDGWKLVLIGAALIAAEYFLGSGW